MTFDLHDDEWSRVRLMPSQDVVELAADLDILIPADVDKRTLLASCIPRLVALGRAQGLPFSAYDQEDLEGLDPTQLATLASMLSVKPTVREILRAGDKVFRAREKERSRGSDPVALLLPSLLPVVLRCALEAHPSTP